MENDRDSERRSSEVYAEVHFKRIAKLQELGWSPDDAGMYAELYEISLNTELVAAELKRAQVLEQKHNAPENFGIFRKENPEIG